VCWQVGMKFYCRQTDHMGQTERILASTGTFCMPGAHIDIQGILCA